LLILNGTTGVKLAKPELTIPSSPSFEEVNQRFLEEERQKRLLIDNARATLEDPTASRKQKDDARLILECYLDKSKRKKAR